MDIALASCAVLPEPDPDAEPLGRALRTAGLSADTLAWDDPEADFGRARLTVLRSTWNYPQHPDRFLSWAVRTAGVSTLVNPLSAVRWNLHKAYLRELARAGIPVAPSVLLARGERRTLRDVMDRRGWSDVVVKPAVSAASFRTLRVRAADRDAGEAHLASLLQERDALVQPYLASVEDRGERALVWIDGAITHAVRKSPRFGGQDERVSEEAVAVAPAEADVALRAVAAARAATNKGSRAHTDLLYARADLAPGPDGQPVVMELELIEPSLYFAWSPPSLDRFVAGLRGRLAGTRS